MKVYYAHFMGIYNTPQEARDIATLESLGLEVINPNTAEIQWEVDDFKKGKFRDDYTMLFDVIFFTRIRDCEVFAFRALPDGRIPGGVAKELKEAQDNNKIIIELPCSTISISMDGEETREYLRDMGQR